MLTTRTANKINRSDAICILRMQDYARTFSSFRFVFSSASPSQHIYGLSPFALPHITSHHTHIHIRSLTASLIRSIFMPCRFIFDSSTENEHFYFGYGIYVLTSARSDCTQYNIHIKSIAAYTHSHSCTHSRRKKIAHTLVQLWILCLCVCVCVLFFIYGFIFFDCF